MIEVENISQLKEVYPLKPERILLDNFNRQALEEALLLRQKFFDQGFPKIPFEASGNMNAERLGQIAHLGLDYVSIGKLHTVFRCLI